MKIEILGTGCKKCNQLEANAKAAADKLGAPYELVHVKDLTKIASYGVMLTPALVIDSQVRVVGQVASEAEITRWLNDAFAKR
jgi:small redox-active disulfide protein 2